MMYRRYHSSDKTSSQASHELPSGSGSSNEPRQPGSAMGHTTSELQPVFSVALAFPTTPNMDPETVVAAPLTPSQLSERSTYFGFINMERPKCLLDTRGFESFKCCILVTILLFLVGFTYGLLNTLNGEIPDIVSQTMAQTISITSLYFAGNIFGPLLLGQWILRRFGFKATFVTSLGIYTVGTLMFWPAGALKSYPGFLVSNVVVGFGLSIIQAASNCFLTLCGSPQHAEFRLLLAQSGETIAVLGSGLLARKVFFVHVFNARSLIDVQWTYLAVAFFSVFLGLVFYYMPLPEATDSELQSQTERLYYPQKYFGRLPLVFITLAMAVLSMFLYNGAYYCLETFFFNLLMNVSHSTHTTLNVPISDLFAIGTSVWVVSQFLYAFLCLLIPPRILLLLAYMGSIILSVLLMDLHLPSDNLTSALRNIGIIFAAPIFPLVFAIGLRGLGRWTKLAACLITSAYGAGAIAFPWVMLAVSKTHGIPSNTLSVLSSLSSQPGPFSPSTLTSSVLSDIRSTLLA